MSIATTIEGFSFPFPVHAIADIVQFHRMKVGYRDAVIMHFAASERDALANPILDRICAHYQGA